MGIVPATKILNEEAQGFHLEIYLTGDKCLPLPLGGLAGLSTLLSTIREIPQFSKIPPIFTPAEPGENIIIKTVEFAQDVSILYILFTFHSLFLCVCCR